MNREQSLHRFIYLIGMPGSGKTAWGKKLADAMHVPHYDTDQWIEANSTLKIDNLFARFGEPYFRMLEGKALLEVLHQKPGIVSTGGGLPCSEENMNFLKSTGILIWIRPDIEQILKYWKDRPIILSNDSEDLITQLKTLEAQRIPFYSQAHLEFHPNDTDPSQLDQLMHSIKKFM